MKDDGRPQYLQVADDLRQKIIRGDFPVGDLIPSTAELQSLYGVSSTVVRAAVNELRIEGTVRGRPGKGVEVQRIPDPSRTPPPSNLMEALDAIRTDLASLNGRLHRVEEALRQRDARSSRRLPQSGL